MTAGRRSDGVALFAQLYYFAGLVGSHEATVAGNVRRKDSRQPSFYLLPGQIRPLLFEKIRPG